MGTEAWPGKPFFDRLWRLARYGHMLLAGVVRVFDAIVLNGLELGRDQLQLFAVLDADLLAKFAATGTSALGWLPTTRSE